jgi:hypothetical protein
MLNAVSFLFEREDIPPEVPKYIMLYCLDTYNTHGESGKSGTSKMAMMFLANWLNQLSNAKNFPIYCRYLQGREVTVGENSETVEALQQGGSVVLRLWYDCPHYVLLTGIRSGEIEMFDPYYRKRPFSCGGVEMLNTAFSNRSVSFERFNSSKRGYYTLEEPDEREAVVIFNANTRKSPEDTIEYFL